MERKPKKWQRKRDSMNNEFENIFCMYVTFKVRLPPQKKKKKLYKQANFL